jgi:transposase-like protein
MKRRTGAGSVKRVALGITDEGRKEIIDFTIAQGESECAWQRFLCDLYQRGLDGDGLERIITDGGRGLLAALALVYPGVGIQRCWAHKTRNVLNYVRKADQNRVKADLRKISQAQSLQKAQKALGRFSARWKEAYPKALKCLLADEEELLTFFTAYKIPLCGPRYGRPMQLNDDFGK